MKIPAPLANAIIVLVSLVWAGNFLASVFLPGYTPDATINFVFMTIVGGALALRGGEGSVSGLISRVIRPAEPPAPRPPDEPQGRP